jgi:hypothetical protein
MAPSAVNDVIRQIMADVRSFYDAAALLAASPANFTGTLQYGGVEVGFRGLAYRDVATTGNTAATDAGNAIRFTGSDNFTFTCDSDPASTSLITLISDKTGGTLTIAASGTLNWLNASGSVPTGSRTLAAGGIATVWHYSGGGSYYIWGSGLS